MGLPINNPNSKPVLNVKRSPNIQYVFRDQTSTLYFLI